MTEIIQIYLFFFLRLYKYTHTISHRWTAQFRFKEMQFHEKEGVTPHDSPAKVFLQAWAIKLFLDTQKNSIRSKSTNMGETDSKHRNLVSAAARSFLHIHQHNAEPEATI